MRRRPPSTALCERKPEKSYNLVVFGQTILAPMSKLHWMLTQQDQIRFPLPLRKEHYVLVSLDEFYCCSEFTQKDQVRFPPPQDENKGLE